MSEPEIVNISVEKERKPSESSDTEYDPQFKPIISLPEVEIITNEEHETEILKIRAKLYRFDSANDPPEWKERGTGDLKLLRDTKTNAVRIVMRRDKTLKVCANHFITPWMELKPNMSCEKAFVYRVLADFADETIKSECLAVKFATVDNANLFKSKFEEARKIITESDLYNGNLEKKENSFENSEEDQKDPSETTKEKNETEEAVRKKMDELNVGKEK